MVKIVTIIGMSLLGFTCAAQSSQVVTMLLPNMDYLDTWVASVIGEDAAATSYSVTCGAGPSTYCRGAPPFTAIQGSATAAYYYTLTSTDVVVSYGCSVGGSTFAVCSMTVTGAGTMDPAPSTFTYANNLPNMKVLVTVTAGSIAQGTGGAASATSATSATSGGDPSSNTSTTAAKTSQQSSASTKSSTGDSIPIMTSNVKLAVGGAVLALAAAGIH